MRCFFCDASCEIVTQELADSYTATITYYKCTPCKASFTYYHEWDAGVRQYQFDVDDYTVFFTNEEAKECAVVRHGPTNPIEVLVLNFIPNITPKNFKKKLPTLLTFL